MMVARAFSVRLSELIWHIFKFHYQPPSENHGIDVIRNSANVGFSHLIGKYKHIFTFITS